MTRNVALTGVYGGTFNPIHLGHLRAAEEVVEALGLVRMLFVPSAEPPHKPRERGDIASARERLAWARLAVSGNPRFQVDPIEVERRGSSYSVDTLRELGQRLAPELPVFTIGRDAFVEMDTWREPETIFTLAHIAVTTRPEMRRVRPIDAAPNESVPSTTGGSGAKGATLREWLPDCVRDHIELAPDGRSGRHRNANTWIRLIEVTDLDISASDIRERIQHRLSTRYLLPEAVRDAVDKSGAYADSGGRVEPA